MAIVADYDASGGSWAADIVNNMTKPAGTTTAGTTTAGTTTAGTVAAQEGDKKTIGGVPMVYRGGIWVRDTAGASTTTAAPAASPDPTTSATTAGHNDTKEAMVPPVTESPAAPNAPKTSTEKNDINNFHESPWDGLLNSLRGGKTTTNNSTDLSGIAGAGANTDLAGAPPVPGYVWNGTKWVAPTKSTAPADTKTVTLGAGTAPPATGGGGSPPATAGGGSPPGEGDSGAPPKPPGQPGKRAVYDPKKKTWVFVDVAKTPGEGVRNVWDAASESWRQEPVAKTPAMGKKNVWDAASESWRQEDVPSPAAEGVIATWDAATESWSTQNVERPDATGWGRQYSWNPATGKWDLVPLTADQLAQQAALTSAMGAQSRGIGGAQAAGLSPAQAAAMGAQGGMEAYSEAYGGTLPELTGQTVEMRGQDINAELAKLGYATDIDIAKLQSETQKIIEQMGINFEQAKLDAASKGTAWQAAAQAALSFLQGKLGAGVVYSLDAAWQWLTKKPSLLPTNPTSDVRAKTDIKDGHGMLDSVARSIRPYAFKYRSSPGRQEYGVMAQELERTPLRSVVMDTPEGKKLDSGRLTAANTAMISELSDKLDRAFRYVRGGKNA